MLQESILPRNRYNPLIIHFFISVKMKGQYKCEPLIRALVRHYEITYNFVSFGLTDGCLWVLHWASYRRVNSESSYYAENPLVTLVSGPLKISTQAECFYLLRPAEHRQRKSEVHDATFKCKSSWYIK